LTVLGVLIGGGLGALARYHVGGLVGPRQQTPFPLGTLLVNVAGSLILGLLVALVAVGRLPEDWLVWGGVGFCGGLTTFSTFTYETLQLVEQRSWRYAWRNLILSGPLSFALAGLGFLIGSTF
jgi:CrcB protein